MDGKIKKLLGNKGDNYIFPFFWLHGEDEATLRHYVGAIDQCNVKAFCVESRPHPDFCGDRWWHDMDVIIEEAKKRNMKIWILDDSHFPTGYANGAMKTQSPELCRQSICCRHYDLKENEKLYIPEKDLLHPAEFQKTMIEQYLMKEDQRKFDDDRLLSVFAVRMGGEDGFTEHRVDLQPMIENQELKWTAPEGEWRVFVLHLSRNYGYHRDYINMMNKKSCRVLIDAVYEPHYAHYKEEFGKTIAGFFSDEPELGNGHIYETDNGFGTDTDFPWSDELEEKLQEKLGSDYRYDLALLWENCTDQDITAKIRYTYMQAVTELVREDFSNQLGDWCREHGVKYIGHLIEDDNHHTRTGSSLGHYFRGLAGQDMAGIDDIGGQVYPQGEDIHYNRGIFDHRNGEFDHYMLGKLASSAAAIDPLKKGNSLCEIFGNYGWSEGVQLEKYLTDHFLVRGINHFVPHAFSAAAYPDPDCPPHFYAHGNNPQYRHFGCLMNYMNRVCELLSGGRHVAYTAVMYHAEGEWTGRCMTSDKVAHVLADTQMDYDYIPQDVFSDRAYYNTVIGNGLLKVNTQEYTNIIIPYMQYVTKELAEAAIELAGEGIDVIFADGYPEGICNAPVDEKKKAADLIVHLHRQCRCVKLQEISEDLRSKNHYELQITPADNRIRYLHYENENNTDIWMFVNEGTDIYNGRVRINKEPQGKAYCYDAWNNCLKEAAMEEGEFVLSVEPLKSVILILDPSASEQELRTLTKNEFVMPEKAEPVEFLGAWKRSCCRSIDYPSFENEKEISLPDRMTEEKPGFSGFVRYENSFHGSEGGQYCLEITDAAEGVEVFINGRSLGIQIVPVYRYNLSGHVVSGENRVVIEVATTLERENIKAAHNTQACDAKSESGITGKVELWRCR